MAEQTYPYPFSKHLLNETRQFIFSVSCSTICWLLQHAYSMSVCTVYLTSDSNLLPNGPKRCFSICTKHIDGWEEKSETRQKKVETKKAFFPIEDVRNTCVCANSPVSNQNSNSIRFYCNQIGICVKVKWHSNSLWQTPECAKLHLNQPRKKKHKRPMSIHHTQTYIFISVSIYQSNNSVAFYLVHLVGIFCGWFCPSSLRFSIAAWWSFKQISG